MLLILVTILVLESLLAIKNDKCCCGCPSPCPLTLRSECGASPSTPCSLRASFNQSELVDSCDSIIRLSKSLEDDDFIPIVKDSSNKSLGDENIRMENISQMEVIREMPTRVRIFKFMNSGENNIVKDFIDESGHSGQDLGEIAEKITFLNQQVTNRLGGLLHSVFDGVSSFLRSQDDILIRK